MDSLDVLADLATIITAAVAAYGYGAYRLSRRRRMAQVEKLLATKDKLNDDTLLVSQISAVLKMTDEQVIDAAYHSKKIEGSEGQIGRERRLKLIRTSKNPSSV